MKFLKGVFLVIVAWFTLRFVLHAMGWFVTLLIGIVFAAIFFAIIRREDHHDDSDDRDFHGTRVGHANFLKTEFGEDESFSDAELRQLKLQERDAWQDEEYEDIHNTHHDI